MATPETYYKADRLRSRRPIVRTAKPMESLILVSDCEDLELCVSAPQAALGDIPLRLAPAVTVADPETLGRRRSVELAPRITLPRPAPILGMEPRRRRLESAPIVQLARPEPLR